MPTIAALFRDRDRALQAVAALQAEGFSENDVTVIASPTSAGQVARQAASELEPPASRMIDLGAAIGGQAELGFPEAELTAFEERVAQGDTVIRVDLADLAERDRANAILRAAGADQVLPGTLRD